MSDSLQLHGLQHTRLPCPSLSPGICSNSCPLSWWCYLTISSSAIPFSFCLQFFLASGYFPMSHLFASCGQSIRASASASVLPMNIQSWFPLELTGFLLAVQGTLRDLLQHHNWKMSVLRCSAFFMVQLSHPYMTTGETIALLSKWCLCFLIHCLGFHSFSSKEQVSLNFTAAVTYYAIQFTGLTCTTLWFFVHSQSCATMTTVNFRAFFHPQRDSVPVSNSLLPLSPALAASNVLLVSVDLSTSYNYGIIK